MAKVSALMPCSSRCRHLFISRVVWGLNIHVFSYPVAPNLQDNYVSLPGGPFFISEWTPKSCKTLKGALCLLRVHPRSFGNSLPLSLGNWPHSQSVGFPRWYTYALASALGTCPRPGQSETNQSTPSPGFCDWLRDRQMTYTGIRGVSTGTSAVTIEREACLSTEMAKCTS